MKIRFARPADLNELLELERLCFGAEAYDSYTVKKLLSFENSIALVATLNSKIVGYAVATYDESVGKLWTIDVHPSYQRRGIGSALLLRTEKMLQQKKTRTIALEVSVNNDAAVAFYKKASYKITGKIENYYRNGSDALIMEKEL